MDARIVGRDGELAAVQEVLGGLGEGPCAVLLEGEAGIGKTTVWRAALAAAGAEGRHVLRCTGDQAEATLSFVGLADLLDGIGAARLAKLPPPQREALEIALLRRARGSEREAGERAVGIALRSVLADLARTAPVLVAVDDVQWLDGASARAIAFALRRLADHPVGVLASARVPRARADPLGLERALSPGRLARMRVGPLEPGALRALIEERLGHRHPRPLLLRIARAAGGNPLFALELARVLGATPALEPGAALPIPETLRELVAGRVAGLSPAAREALLVVAAMARPDIAVVEQAAPAGGLVEAEEAGVVRVESRRVAFAHPLYGSAIYAAAPGERRRALHGRLAELVAGPERRAYHLARAAAGPGAAVADAVEGGASDARARGAWESAGELFEQARALTPPDRPEEACRRAVAAAECAVRAGDRPRARALLEEVLASGPPRELRSDALRLLAGVRYNEQSFAEAGQLLQAALADARDPGVAVAIELSFSYVAINHLGDFAGADAHAARALERATPLGGPVLAEALGVRAMVDYLVGRGVDWARVERALELEDRSRAVSLELRPSFIAGLLELYTGRLADARERFDALRAAAVAAGDEGDLALLLAWQAWLETLSGDLAAALTCADAALAQAELTGSEATRAWGLAHRALVHAHLGQAAPARADAEAATAVARRLGTVMPLIWVGAARALLELSLGEPAAAWSAVEPLVAALVETGDFGEPVGAYFLPAGVEGLIATGDLARAAGLLDRFESRARAVDRAWALATAARCRALLAAARGDLGGAARALERGLAEHARLEMPFELARTLLVQAQVRRRRRDRRRARESAERALALFEGMGARRWAQRARQEGSRVRPSRPPGALTAGEQRVARLAREGRSNKAIAAELAISVHTVEVHLSRAYAKLGIHSRSQLARALPAVESPST